MKGRATIALLILLGAAWPFAATAGEAATAAEQPAGKISSEDLAARAEAVLKSLDDSRPTAQTIAGIDAIEVELAKAAPSLDRLLEEAREQLSEDGSIGEIQDVHRQLEAAAGPIAIWTKTLKTESERAQASVEDSLARQRAWTSGRESDEIQALGSVALDRVDTVLAALSRSIEEQRTWQKRVLQVDAKVAERSSAVSTVIQKLETAAIQKGTGLFIPDRPVLWRRDMLDRAREELPQVPELVASLSRDSRAYVGADPRPFFLHALIAALLIAGLGRVASRVRSRRSVDQDATISPFVEMPWAAGILLAVLATPFVHPLAPRRILQWFAILAMFPAMAVLRRARGWGSPALLLGGISILVLERVSLALDPVPTLGRFVSVAVLTLGIAFARLAAASVPASAGKEEPVRRGADLATAVLVVGIVAEIGGWSTLATLVRRTFVSGTLVGIILLATVLLLDDLVAVMLRSHSLQRSLVIRENIARLARTAGRMIRLAAIGVGGYLVLLANGLWPAFKAGAARVLQAGFQAGDVSISVGGVFGFILTLIFVPLAVRVVTTVLEEEVYPRTSLPRGMPLVLSTFVRYGLYTLGVIMALSAAGVGLSQVAIMLGGVGVGVGLGLQDVVRNFVAGIILLVERRIHVGDAVQIPGKGIFGRVRGISMRSTVVRNWDGAEVVVPNADLVSTAVTNWTLSDERRRVEIPVTVDDGNDPNVVLEALKAAARGNPLLVEQPPPSALFLGFSNASLKFVLRGWTDAEFEKTSALVSELGLAVHRRLDEAGVRMPPPEQEAAGSRPPE